MSKKNMTKKKPKGKTKWNKLKSLTEEQIISAAKPDPDAKPVSRAQLEKFKRVTPPAEINVRKLREKLHVSQTAFAEYFGVNIRTIQEWEQHRRTPNAIARNFLKIIEKAPKTVLKVLST